MTRHINWKRVLLAVMIGYAVIVLTSGWWGYWLEGWLAR